MTVPSLIQSAKSTSPGFSPWTTERMNLMAVCSRREER